MLPSNFIVWFSSKEMWNPFFSSSKTLHQNMFIQRTRPCQNPKLLMISNIFNDLLVKQLDSRPNQTPPPPKFATTFIAVNYSVFEMFFFVLISECLVTYYVWYNPLSTLIHSVNIGSFCCRFMVRLYSYEARSVHVCTLLSPATNTSVCLFYKIKRLLLS